MPAIIPIVILAARTRRWLVADLLLTQLSLVILKIIRFFGILIQKSNFVRMHWSHRLSHMLCWRNHFFLFLIFSNRIFLGVESVLPGFRTIAIWMLLWGMGMDSRWLIIMLTQVWMTWTCGAWGHLALRMKSTCRHYLSCQVLRLYLYWVGIITVRLNFGTSLNIGSNIDTGFRCGLTFIDFLTEHFRSCFLSHHLLLVAAAQVFLVGLDFIRTRWTYALHFNGNIKILIN